MFLECGCFCFQVFSTRAATIVAISAAVVKIPQHYSSDYLAAQVYLEKRIC